MARFLGSRGCLICGQDNPVGLRLRYRVDERGAVALWTPAEHFQGFGGVIHGGVVLGLLDDAMWYAAYGQGGVTLTAEATVRYQARVAVGVPIVVSGRVAAHRGRLWECVAEVRTAEDGRLLAQSQAKFLGVPAADLPALVGDTRVHELPEA